MNTNANSKRTRLLTASSTAILALALAIGNLAFAEESSSGLPDYEPSVDVTGTLRSSGNAHMQTLMKYWQQGFKKYHPDVRFDDQLEGTATGMYGIEHRLADMALMSRPIYPYERYGTYERSWIFPREIQVATGAYDSRSKSPALSVYVHKDNPLRQLTLEQLDGIYGARRTGGWESLYWNTEVARGDDKNIRTWGQLGLTGQWADKPIHVYGPAGLGAGAVTLFQSRILGGGAIWNQDLREYPDRDEMIARLSNDLHGIAYAPLHSKTNNVKTIALAETERGPYVPLSKDTVADRTYPLHRSVFIVYAIDNEENELSETFGDPRVKEFLRYILSKQGQQAVVREGHYLPLTPAAAREQLAKVESTEYPPERAILDE